MFGLTNYVPLILAGVLSLGSFLAGWSFNGTRWESKYTQYRQEVERLANDQRVKNEALAKQQGLINEATKATYEARIAALKRLYGGGVQHNQGSGGSVPGLPTASSGTDGTSSDLTLDCSLTTQQLISLQDWINKQTRN
jgi:hypothetical protein